MNYFVEIIRYEDGRVEERVGPETSMNKAEKIERGVNINLDHENYYTRIIDDGCGVMMGPEVPSSED